MLTTSLLSRGQDMQFTQFNAASLYLNPGFTGSTIEHRFASNYRNQWVAIPGHFVNYTFAYDYNAAELNSGIGLLFAREQAGTANLHNTEIGLLYSYHLKINHKIFIQPGLKINYISRGIDFQKLVFNSQLSSGSNNSPSNIEVNNINIIDINSGIVLYSSKFWAGLSFNHLNRPNQSFINNESPLFMKLSVHGGYKFEIASTVRQVKNFNIIFQYKSQQKFDQLDLGAYYTQNTYVLGLWYRGIPILKSQNGILNNDAIAFIAGYVFTEYNLSIGYSYDVTISKLGVNSAGSQEITLIYEVASKKAKRKRRKDFVPCAKF